MDKDVKDIIEWLGDKSGDVANIWEMSSLLSDPQGEDKATLLKIFNPEQLAVIAQLATNVVSALEFHSQEDEEAHPIIRNKLDKTEAKLRSHRHQMDKNYSAKAEF